MVYILAVLIALIIVDLYLVDSAARYLCDRTYTKNPRLFFGQREKKVNPKSKSRQRAKELEKTVTERYEIIANDGVKLAGHYYPCDNAKRVVIAVHGWKSSWSYDFNAQAEFLHGNGCSILFVELRAHGNSEGRYMYYGKRERFDLQKWAELVENEIAKGLPVYFYGMSMGSTLSVMASDLFGDSVKGIIADGVTPTPRTVMKSIVKFIHLSPALFYWQIRIDLRLRLKCDDNDYTALMALENCKTPILMPYGTADVLTTPAMAMQVFDKIKAPKKAVEFKGTGHMKSYYTDTEKYQKEVLQFFCDQEK